MACITNIEILNVGSNNCACNDTVNLPTNRKSIGPHTNLFFPEVSKTIAMARTLVVFDN